MSAVDMLEKTRVEHGEFGVRVMWGVHVADGKLAEGIVGVYMNVRKTNLHVLRWVVFIRCPVICVYRNPYVNRWQGSHQSCCSLKNQMYGF